MLKAVAAVAASTASAPALGVASQDPIFALIEEHRRLYKAYGDVLSLRDVEFDVHDHPEDPRWRALEQACDDAGDACWKSENDLVLIGATTPVGVGRAAALRG